VEAEPSPIDLMQLVSSGRAKVTHSPLAAGELSALGDGNRYNGVEFAAGSEPAWIQIALARPIALSQVSVTPGLGGAEWSLEAADTPAELSRAPRKLVGPRNSPADEVALAGFEKPRLSRIYRLTLRAATPGARPRLGEWTLWTPQRLEKMRIEAFSDVLAVNGNLPLRVNGTGEAGGRRNVTPDVTWQIEPRTRGTVDAFSRFVAAEAGPVRITALHEGVRSEPLELTVLPEGRPDWSVAYLERQPRFPLDGTTRLTPGQTVQWFAHVKNYGTGDAAPAGAEWRIDGQPVRTFRFGKVERFHQIVLILSTKWDGQRHRIELVVDPAGEVEETCETNNAVAVDTDAHPVGFWVEDSVLRYFHRRQADLKVAGKSAGNSWEDWAQRQVTAWNSWLDRKSWPWLEPGRAEDRWRLDRIIEVGDGMLPLAGGSAAETPDTRDQTVLLSLGFPARELRGPRYRSTTGAELSNPFYVDASLAASLARTRFPKPGE
jgi:hypothetical protein